MEISVRSEVDSRVLVYPMIKVLSLYGTVAVYTSNRFMSRLIENELEGGFKNIRIVVSPEADIEAAMDSDEYYQNKYDFLIYDNMGAVDYDMLIAIATGHISENYVSDMLYIASDAKTHVLKFGKPGITSAPKKEKKSKKELVDEAASSLGDFSENKWDNEKTDEQLLQELLENKESKWIKFPTFEAIDDMESKHIMMVPEDSLINELYRLFKDYLHVDERQFKKGAKLKDESGSDIYGTDIR